MQAINLPFVSEEELAAFSDDGTASGVVTVRNPLRDDQSKLRQSLLPGLLWRVRDNRNRGSDSVALFETGRVFYARPWLEDGRVPDQPMRLAVAVAGPFGLDGLDARAASADAATSLGLVHALADGMGVRIERTAAEKAGFHPTRCAQLSVAGRVIGHAGELHPDIVEMFEMDGRIAIVELDLDALVAPQPSVQMAPVSTYPHVDFDLSFEVELAANAADLVAATTAVSPLIESATVFDDYRSVSGERAVAIRYRLRATDRTLDADEIGAEREKMIAVAAGLGARLRGGA